jgi:WD40 repeat protein
LISHVFREENSFAPPGLSEQATVQGTPAGGGADLPVVPGYDVLEELGRGGMGVVYRAWQLRPRRVVALKMILAGDHAGPEALARFEVEAEAVARLQHPQIVPIYEVGEHYGRPYFTLEYLPGGSLERKLTGTPQPAGGAAELVETLARAMHHAHGQGIVHRDLKPANVLLSADGTPKITDFGLAKLLAGGGGVQTQSGAILGTPSYMAPEQAGGKRQEIGPAVDVYALGAILYELLTGRPPFRGETPLETLHQVQAQEPVPPSRLQPRLPRDLTTICLKCLAKEPRKRYASAAALADDLHRFLANRPIQARRTGVPERAWRWCRRNPGLAGLAATVVLLLVLVALGSSVVAWWLRQERDIALGHETEAYFAQASAGRWSGQLGRRFASLQALDRAAQVSARLEPDPDWALHLRNETIGCLVLADLRMTGQWDGFPPGTERVAFDAALQRYARCDQQGRISIRRVKDDTEIAQLPGLASGSWGLLFSPDGNFLATLHPPGRLRVWHLGRNQAVLEPPDKVHSLDFSPDSRQLAVGHPADGSISLYALASGERVGHLAAGPTPDRLAFHPDGRQLAVASHLGQPAVHVRDLSTGKVLVDLPHPDGVWAIAWRGDGKLLAAGCQDRRIYVWDMTVHKQIAVLEGHTTGAITDLAFNHAGDLLASTSWDSTVRLWDPLAGKQLVSTTAMAQEVLRFSPDDKRLACGIQETKLWLWEVAAGREYRTLVSSPAPDRATYHGGDISPDGRLLAVGMEDGVRLWDLGTGNEVAFLPCQRTTAVLFQPGGKELLTGGDQELYRWPIRADPQAAVLWHVGPPKKLAETVPVRAISYSRDGRTLGFTHYGSHGVILDMDRPTGKARRLDHPEAWSIAVSPDGQWAATGTWNGEGVKVWDARSGKFIADLWLRAGHTATVCFSPDGQWLVTGTRDTFRFLEVGSWRLRRQRPSAGVDGPAWIAFSSDGKMVALPTSPAKVQLLDPATGHELATLEDPNPQRVGWLGFSPDSRQLVVVPYDAGAVRLWDLGLIRRQLAERGRDWDRPPCPPPTGNGQPAPLRIQVELNADLYHHRGTHHRRLKRFDEAIKDYQEALRREPDRLLTCAHLAWTFVMGPAELRDPKQAKVLIERAIKKDRKSRWFRVVRACAHLAWTFVMGPAELRDPKQAKALIQQAIGNTPDSRWFPVVLGVAYYRLGEYPQAVKTLTKNLEGQSGPILAYDYYFLAMSYHQLRQTDEAQKAYRKALELQKRGVDLEKAEELNALRIEAEAILGLPVPR